MTNEGKRRVLLVNNVVYLPGEGGYKRTMFMLDMMKERGYEVTLITSDFNHYSKQGRDIEAFRKEYPQYSHIEFLHMPVYRKNVSFQRIFAESYWARQLKKWLKAHIREFDVVFFSDIDYIMPVRKLCQKNHVKMIVDIRDLRPEVFRVVVKNELLYQVLFFPMKLRSDVAYGCADELVAVSQEYLDRGLQTNKKAKDPVVVYLGTTFDKFFAGVAQYSDAIEKPEGELWVIYAGTLGESYDLKTVIQTAKIMEDRGMGHIRFKILGQGPEEEKLKAYAREIGVQNVEFVGFLPYEQMAAYLCRSDMTLNALKRNASQSIINKVADYFSAGIPILNGSCCKEMQDMVEKYQVGLNYRSEDAQDLAEKILHLADDPAKRKVYGENAKALAMAKFDRRTSYLELLKRIDNV